MASRAARIAPEDDDDDVAEGQAPANLKPAELPGIGGQQRQAAVEDEIDVIETDEQGKPISGQREDAEDEATLAEDDYGPRGLLDQERRVKELVKQQGQYGEQGQGGDPNENRKSRRQRQKEARDSMQAENAALKLQLDELRADQQRFQGRVEPKLNEIDASRVREQAAALENHLAAAIAEAARSEKSLATAIREGDEDAVITALRANQNAFLRQKQLESQKASLAATGGQDQAEPQRQPAARRVDPVMKQRADDFLAEHDWIEPDKKPAEQSEDSRHALFIDEQVRAAGFNPTTDDYWDELDSRLRTALPHRFERRRPERTNGAANGNVRLAQREQVPAARRGPMTSGAAEGRSRDRQVVHISPGRRAALVQQGVIGTDGSVLDAAKYKRVIKGFMEFDRANGLAG